MCDEMHVATRAAAAALFTSYIGLSRDETLRVGTQQCCESHTCHLILTPISPISRLSSPLSSPHKFLHSLCRVPSLLFPGSPLSRLSALFVSSPLLSTFSLHPR